MNDQAPTTESQSPARQPKRTRTVQLMTRVLAANWFTVEDLAAALVVDPRTIGCYVSGEISIPLERQVCFARFLIERVPPFARHGRNLLSQISASIEFANSTTKLHDHAPVSRSRTF